MKRKILASMLVAAGLAAIANVGYTSKAFAERVFDTSTMSWKEVDPNRRVYSRKAPPKQFNRKIVAISTKERPGTIIVHTDAKYLYLVQGGGRAIRYGVGVGREGFTWAGNNLTIKRKAEWPDWTPPPEMVAREAAAGHKVGYMPGGEDNPLGARALYLYKGGADTGYRIHGTNQPWSIGLNLSSGCIRMMNKDVTDLYSRANVGTKVIVIGQGENPNRYFTPAFNPLAALSKPKFGIPKAKKKVAKIAPKNAGVKNAGVKTVAKRPTIRQNISNWQKYWKKKLRPRAAQ